MITFESISDVYADAKRDIAAAESDVSTHEAKGVELRTQRQEASHELERLLELEQSDHVSRVLDGDAAAPRKPKRLTRIANLQEMIAGIDASIPVHHRRLEEARSRLKAARQRVGEAILPHIIKQKSAAFAKCAEPLEELLTALVDAAAIDLLQEQFSGDGGIRVARIPDQGGLFSARIILDRFKKTLPPRFAQLAADSLAGADARIAVKAKSFAQQLGA